MNGVKVLQAEPEDEAAQRILLNDLDCFDHKYGPWREDIERDERDRKTESCSCLECGKTQTRRS